jgi:hypothetical protein
MGIKIAICEKGQKGEGPKTLPARFEFFTGRMPRR